VGTRDEGPTIGASSGAAASTSRGRGPEILPHLHFEAAIHDSEWARRLDRPPPEDLRRLLRILKEKAGADS